MGGGIVTFIVSSSHKILLVVTWIVYKMMMKFSKLDKENIFEFKCYYISVYFNQMNFHGEPITLSVFDNLKVVVLVLKYSEISLIFMGAGP